MGTINWGEYMNRLAIAFNTIDHMLKNNQKYGLNHNEISALEDAQKAILTIETLGLSLKNDDVNIT